MNIERKNIDEVNATITLHVEKSDYEARCEKKLRSYKQKVSMPGFRAGHVPAQLVKKMYGKSILIEELDQIISENLLAYIKDNKIKILGEPLQSENMQQVDLDKDENFDFSFDIAIAPTFDLKYDKSVSIPSYDIKIEDEMIESTIKSYTSRYGTYEDAKDVEDGDILKGEIIEIENGVAKENGINVQDAVIYPKYMKDENQKKAFIGAKDGQEVTFNPKAAYEGNKVEIASLLKISQDQAESIDSDFKFIINNITRYKQAELNQVLFDQVLGEGVVKSEEEFRNRIKDDLAKSLTIDSDFKLSMDVKDEFLKQMESVKFPEEFLKRWALHSNKDLKAEDLEKDFTNSLNALKWHLAKEKIAEDNAIKVEDADIKEFAKKTVKAFYAQNGSLSLPEDLVERGAKELLSKKENYTNLVDKVVEEKVIAIIKEKASLDKKSVTLDEFNKMFENQGEEK